MCHQSDTTITGVRRLIQSGAAQRRRSGNSPKNDCRATWASHRSATPVIRQAAEFPYSPFLSSTLVTYAGYEPTRPALQATQRDVRQKICDGDDRNAGKAWTIDAALFSRGLKIFYIAAAQPLFNRGRYRSWSCPQSHGRWTSRVRNVQGGYRGSSN